MMWNTFLILLLSSFSCLSLAAETSLFHRHFAQKPLVELPKAGSVVGDLAHIGQQVVNESLGSFTLPLGMNLPKARGPLMVPSMPTYSPGFGVSWLGMGWDWSFHIQRFRQIGSLNFYDDDLKTPWGHFVAEGPSKWVSAGLTSPITLKLQNNQLIATHSDGSIYTFEPMLKTPSLKTFAWYLIKSQNIFGWETHISYDFNSSGYPYPKIVSYGGSNEAEYEIEFCYQPWNKPFFVDYRSQKRVELDRVLSSLKIKSKASGHLVDLYTYEFIYKELSYLPRPYLVSVTKVYPNLEKTPSQTFAYGDLSAYTADNFKGRDIPLSQFPKLYSDLQNNYGSVDWSKTTRIDINNDGAPVLEVEEGEDRLFLDKNGLIRMPNPFPGTDTPLYKNHFQEPCEWNVRTWGRFFLPLFGRDKPLYEVLTTRRPFRNPKTQELVKHNTFVVCKESDRTFVDVVSFEDDMWSLDKKTRFADLTNTGKPDIITVEGHRYFVRKNESTESHLHFPLMVSGELYEPVLDRNRKIIPGQEEPTRISDFHIADINGDGIPDLVGLYEDMIYVWYGHGDGTFERVAQEFRPIFDISRSIRTDQLLKSAVHFEDLNGDGIADLFVVDPSDEITLFINNGTDFVRSYDVPRVIGTWDNLIVNFGLDLIGSGNFQILYSNSILEVNQPYFGLMTSAEDGTGNRLAFEYTRGPRKKNLPQRPIVLKKLHVYHGGETPSHVAFDYENPISHSQKFHFLGFESVTTTTPLRKVLSNFWHTDTQTGLLLAQETVHTLLPNVVSFLKRSLDEVKGPTQTWWRLKKEEAGLKNAWGTGATTTLVQSTKEYTRYEKDICPVEVAETSPAGTLVSTTTLTSPRGLQGAHHCLPGQVSLQGRHTNSAFDFAHSLSIERNDKGQTTSLVDDSGALLQKMGYNELGQLISFQELGTLPILFTYAKGLITQVTDPSGPVTQYAYDATKDTLTHVREARGQGEYYRSYNYDSFGRLKESFGGLSHSTLQKALTVSYVWSKDTTPGLVIEENTVAPGRTHVAASYFTSSGKEAFGAAPNGEGQWVTSPRAQHRTGEEATITLPPTQAPSAQALGSQEWASLLSAAYSLSTTQEGGLGAPFFTKSTLQQGVNQETANTWELSGQHLIQKTFTNGDLIATRLIGGSGLVEALIQPTGERTGFGYDAAGRLRAVTLAGGSEHRVSYTPKGQIACSERVGLAKLCHTYNAQYQLETSTLVDAKGALQTTFTQSYDALGRITATTTLGSGKKTEVVNYFYDGKRPSKPQLENQQGFLTAIEGPGYTKEFVYRVDGLPLATHLTVGAYTYSQFTSYSELGHVLEVTTTLTGPSGLNHMDTRQPTFDALGRPTGYNRNGKPFVEMAYDAWNRVSSVQIADLTAPSWQGLFDPVTFGLKGYSSPATHVSHSWRLNGKGFVEQETTQNKGSTTTKSHTFSERGYLDSTVVATPQGNKSYSYTYNEAGYSEAWLEAREGSKGYTFDSLGRITANQGHTFTYGASGHIERAQTPQGTFTYTYDEAGQRLAKWDSQGNLVVLYLPSGVILEGATVYEPVIAGKTLLGVLKNGIFHSVQTDIRGTPALTPYSPYGVREGEAVISPVVMDYTQKSFDPALKTVRMGVRDYAPELGSFAQPDLAVFLEPNMCLKSVVDCTLFSYGNNNPVIFTDPTGKFAQIVPFVIIASLSSLPVDTRYDSYARDQLNHAPLNIKLGTYTYETIIGRELLTGRELAPEERWMGFLNGGAAYFNSKIPGFNLIFNGKNKNNGNSNDVDEGTRPPNLSPDGAGRRGAFREAKRQSGIPVSRHPDRVIKNYDRHGKEINPGRQYKWLQNPKDIKKYAENKNNEKFDVDFWKDINKENTITIREDSKGHYYGLNNRENRGPHFNDQMDNHYDY